EADVSVGQHDSPDPVRAGAPLIYTVIVTNNGPASATGVVLTDALPAAAALNSAASTQGSCTGTVTLHCGLGTIASGAEVTVTVAVTPMAAGLITNTAAA